MKVRVIHNDEAHEAAVRELESLITQEPEIGSEEFDRLELLGLVIRDYEERRFPIGLPDPIDAIRFRMEQAGFTKADLKRCLGGKIEVSEVLNRKRSLSLSMVRNLNTHWGIRADTLIGRADRPQPPRRTGGKPKAAR
jgi:HTH-type transcriptional regulator/antitoxin HigA